jgi:AraC-like DNA-binding protein
MPASASTSPTRRDSCSQKAASGAAWPAPSRLVLREIPACVAEHLHEGISLTDLARRLGYSPSHCSTLVRRMTGKRFSALRRRMQLERAIGLLRSGTSVK